MDYKNILVIYELMHYSHSVKAYVFIVSKYLNYFATRCRFVGHASGDGRNGAVGGALRDITRSGEAVSDLVGLAADKADV